LEEAIMNLRNIIKVSFLFMLVAFSSYLPASEKKLLTVNSISESINATFTQQQLMQLPQHEVTTNLPWTEESHRYSGPRLEDVLSSLDAKGQWLTLRALDYYSVSLNLNRIKKFNPILALKIDGKLLTVRSKGPIWLILPVDSYPELNAALYNDYMVWHLVKIDVENKEPQ